MSRFEFRQPDKESDLAYLREMASRQGVLVALEKGDDESEWVCVTGRGTHLDVESLAGVTSVEVGNAADLGPLMASLLDLNGASVSSAGWTSGETAWLLWGHAVCLFIDDYEWVEGEDGVDLVPASDPPADCLVGTCSWEIEGGSGSPGSDDGGLTHLYQIGPHYVLSGSEWTRPLWGASREEAIAALSQPIPSNSLTVWINPESKT